MKNTVLFQEKEQLKTLLAGTGEVGIVVARKHTIDVMGAALALFLSLTDAGKNVQIVSPTDPIVEISNLVGIDQVKKKFDGLIKTLVISVPYKEGEVEKVSFTTDADRMNFNIVGGANGITPFDESEIRLNRKGSAPDLIFAIGVTHQEELTNLIDLSSQKIVNIDTNTANSLYGDVVIVDPVFSSLSEIIAGTIEELGLPLQVDTAQNLLDGISYATRNFSATETSPYAFEAAGLLLQVGARRQSGGFKKEENRPQQFPKTPQSQQHQQQHQQPQSQQHQQQNQQHNQQQSHHQQPQQPKQNQNQPQKQQMRTEPAVAPVAPMNTNTDVNTNINGESPLDDNADVPSDWFVPKVFKGSKNQQ